jgi:diacylglycerol O-acyltransferase
MTTRITPLPGDRPTTPGPPPGPGRILLVTGSMGEGHHAAARAVEERARELWPGVEVVWTETLEGMGRGAGPAFRAIYAGAVRHVPRLYALYFRLLWRVPPFRAGTRAVLGRWSGRGIAAQIAAHRPDLVVATFPEGITGLAHLRRRGRLAVPTVALVADPAPHPLWADAALDLHLVSTDAGAALLERAAPGARVRVAALPVSSRFTPPLEPPAPDRPARPRPLVLLSFGSLAFGDVAGACTAVLDAGADALVGTARNPAVRRRLERVVRRHPRGAALRVVDWIDDPAAATRGCDAVVTNAGGATALEALACARPLLLADPIPGHGRANAEALAAAGLATICDGPDALRAAVHALVDPGTRADAVRRLAARLDGADFAADVAALGSLLARPREHPGGRVRAQDSLFLHAETPRVPQQVGARVMVEIDPAGTDWAAHTRELVRTRAPGIELLCRRLEPAAFGAPLRWTIVDAPDPDRHVRPDVWAVGPGGTHATWDDALTAFFGTPIDPALGWELQVGAAGDGIGVLARVHHSLGDGLAVTDALCRLLTDERAGAAPGARTGGGAPARPAAGARLAHAATVLRGIASLAAAGPAGRSPLVGRSSGPRHRRVGVRLDGAEIRRAARAHGVGTTVLVLAVLADALHHLLGPDAPHRVRAMVPMTTRTRAGVGSRAAGNRTAAVSVDLPTGPMTPAERVALVARAVADGATAGQPEGAAAALVGLGALPRWLQRRLVRLVYGRRAFHLLASVMPGSRRPLHLRGGLITAVYPVLPLAEGVGLAVGALNWGRWTCLGITADDGILPVIGGIPTRLQGSLRGMQRR